MRRDRALERRNVAVRHQPEPRRERPEALPILRLRRQAADRDRAPVEVAFARNDLGAIVRHALHFVRPLARRLERGLDRLEAGIHRQRPVHAGEPAQPREKCGQPVVVISARGHREPARLGGQRAHDARMRVAEAHRGVRRHAIEVAPARLVPDVHTFAAHQDDRQRRVIRRAVPPLERDRERRRRRTGSEQRCGRLLDELSGGRAGVAVGVVFGDLDGERRRVPHQGVENGNERRRTQAARGRRRHTGRVLRIDRVEIQRDAIADGPAPHPRERLVQHLLQSAPRDLAHRVYAHAEGGKQRGLLGLEAAHADHTHVLRREHGAVDAERVTALPEERGERHAVQPPRVARLGRVRVEVRIDPQEPDRSVCHLRHAAPGAHRAAVVAAEHERRSARTQRIRHCARETRAEPADGLRHRLVRRRVGVQRLAPLGGEPARGEMGINPGQPQARRTVGTARRLGAEAARHAEDPNRADALLRCSCGRHVQGVTDVHARLDCKLRAGVRGRPGRSVRKVAALQCSGAASGRSTLVLGSRGASP